MFKSFDWFDFLNIARSAITTLELCFIAIVIGSALGIAVAVMSESKIRALQAVARTYINVVRGIPLLVIIFLIYFGLPMLAGLSGLSAFASGVAALCVYTGAYVGEVVRGGIRAVPRGQFEAASTLGMSYWLMMRTVVLPQAVPVIVPPAIGFLIALVKDSSLVSVVGILELTGAGRVTGSVTTDPILAFLIVAAFYFVISFVLSRLSIWYERRHATGKAVTERTLAR